MIAKSLKEKLNIKIIVTSLMAFSLFLLSMVGNIEYASAGWMCKELGTSGMLPKQVALNTPNAILQDVGNRKYTILELFSSNASSYGVPMGHNKEHWLTLGGNTKVGDAVGGLSTEQEERLLNHGDTGVCMFYGILPKVQNATKGISGITATAINFMVSTFYNPEFICKDPANPTSNCINLLKIVGGEASSDANGGLLGVFSRGFFVPLSSLAFLATAGWIFYQALWKRQFRVGISGILWALLAFTLGIFVLQKPYMVVRIPQEINTVVSTCVVDAINGRSCLSNESTVTTDIYTDDSCLSTGSGGNGADEMQFKINGLACSITKGFTIDRWSEEQFGYSYNELFTKNAPNGFNVYPSEKLQGSPDGYCVNMYSDLSPEELTSSSNPSFEASNNGEVCNIALAYMAERTIGDFGNNAKMEHIIATAAKDGRMWAAFTGQGRDIMGVFSMLSVLAAAITLVPVTLYGHVYSLSATLMLILAPFFLLLAIHPGRGKKMFLGWFETIVSALLKFMATSLYIMIILLVYSTVLSTATGGMAFIVSIILCFTFLNYRKELVNILGVANMGGTKLSNKFEEKYDKFYKKSAGLGKSLVGGAIGGAVAGGATGAWKGAASGLAMEMRKGNSFVANAVRQGGRVSKEMEQERKEFQRDVYEEAKRQEILQKMDEQMGNIASVIQRQTNENLKQSGVDTVNNQIEQTSIPQVEEQLKEARNTIQKSKGKNNIEANTNIAIKQVEEARTIQRHFDNNNGDAYKAKQSYLDEYRQIQEQKIIENAKFLESDSDINRTIESSGMSKEDYISTYIKTEIEKLDMQVKKLDDNISTIASANGENSTFTEFDLVKNISIKEDFSKETVARFESYQKVSTNKSNFKVENQRKIDLPDLDDEYNDYTQLHHKVNTEQYDNPERVNMPANDVFNVNDFYNVDNNDDEIIH